METIDFKEYSTDDFRSALGTIGQGLAAVNLERQQLLKEERTLSTVMYMLFPKEAVRDGYLSATRALTARLNAEKRKRHDRKTCSVEGCVEEERSKGMCSLHYSREYWKKKRAARRSDLRSTAKVLTTPEMLKLASRP